MQQLSLFGEPLEVKKKKDVDTLKKIKKAKVVEVDTEKLLKSKVVSNEEKLERINTEVHRILGKYEDRTVCIRSYEEFKSYIDASIDSGIIAIDTETNNSLNTFDCKIMGLCLYTPGQRNAYIPVNHIDINSGELLPNQITEEQIKEQLSRLVNVKKVYHNSVFDVEVIYTTCGIKLDIYWDTLVGAQLINENELKGLKKQYVLHIDSSQEKYNIEHLFEKMQYAIIKPELFALYAATDSFMTYELYKYQKEIFSQPENNDVYKLFKQIEIPILSTIVNMEMTGVSVDLDYDSTISKVYHKKLDEVQKEIDDELLRIKPDIDKWRLSKEANEKPIKNGKQQKSKTEQLKDPPELGSSTQLAILLYDILKAPVIDPKKPRTTDSAVLEELSKSIKLCELMLKQRKVAILINTFIDAIPELVQKDGKVHSRFNSTGTVTGRFACTNPNLQQIPSHDKSIRLIFQGSCEEHSVELEDYYKIKYTDEIEVDKDKWVKIQDIKIGDLILNSENYYDKVLNIVQDGDYYKIFIG